MCVLDASARAMVANVNQLNGERNMMVVGILLTPELELRKEMVMFRSIKKKTPLTKLRTHAMTLQLATICAERNLTHFRGVKGQSILFLLPSFNVVSGLAPDYMHCSWLGATF
jgi:hypothetical protein